MKIEADLLRGVAPMLVLKLLDGRDMYGYELIQAIGRETDGILTLGHSTVYPLLYNLESKGFVEAYWQEGETKRERKYYRITDNGGRRLATTEAQWSSLVRALRGLWPAEPAPNPLSAV